jgi:hypothetical protein
LVTMRRHGLVMKFHTRKFSIVLTVFCYQEILYEDG